MNSPAGPLLDARCPRCGGGFECGAALGPAGRCACFNLRLSERLRAELAARYDGCLCLPCLRELGERDRAQPTMGAASASG